MSGPTEADPLTAAVARLLDTRYHADFDGPEQWLRLLADWFDVSERVADMQGDEVQLDLRALADDLVQLRALVGGRTHRCTYCDDTFGNAADLAAHGISAHGGPLVGGRSAAPTRDQLREAMRRGRRRVPLMPVEAPLPTEREDAMLDELVALLSRSAAEPPATIDGRDHTTDAQTVIAAYLRTADLPAMRGTWAAMCEDVAAEILSELRAAGLVYDGVAAEPNEEPGDGR